MGPGIEKKGIETDLNRNTIDLLYEPSAVKRKRKARLGKRGKGNKMKKRNAKCLGNGVLFVCINICSKGHFPMRISLLRSLPVYSNM